MADDENLGYLGMSDSDLRDRGFTREMTPDAPFQRRNNDGELSLYEVPNAPEQDFPAAPDSDEAADTGLVDWPKYKGDVERN